MWRDPDSMRSWMNSMQHPASRSWASAARAAMWQMQATSSVSRTLIRTGRCLRSSPMKARARAALEPMPLTCMVRMRAGTAPSAIMASRIAVRSSLLTISSRTSSPRERQSGSLQIERILSVLATTPELQRKELMQGLPRTSSLSSVATSVAQTLQSGSTALSRTVSSIFMSAETPPASRIALCTGAGSAPFISTYMPLRTFMLMGASSPLPISATSWFMAPAATAAATFCLLFFVRSTRLSTALTASRDSCLKGPELLLITDTSTEKPSASLNSSCRAV